MITLTDNAADQVRKVAAEHDAGEKFLRVAVVGGGCSGNQYQLGFDDEYEGDTRVESNGITLVVDERSASMLNGVQIDFVDGLQGSTFVFNNPNAKSGCGCGNSFSCG